ncbi:hypothetical protein LTR02_006946 [Friedmanniomyces endolithicus]|nr:hypothetical protein LTR94_002606 [Friedmanniomyces endolithicus]KAK0810568.1 hypothetical protein LTR75_005553 [Friedmanniomyces endolithicus]KAK0812501.1 hypothetical protein LTR59_001462 [Friedmanniomyces endolithicus]KAK0812632.1 hypothetical protein LTR38_003248 [Friedmanniomyces endolithicus]KAK0855164.1 hypothetical protein LTR03_001930 [Friedmanniomyces endolithicus]
MADNTSSLVQLPSELVLDIFAYLEPLDLASVAFSCKTLSTHSYDDRIWQPLINRNLPEPISEPAPLKTFRELFIAHHPYWFLAKRRLWFSDGEHQGKLVAARYEPKTGCIAAYTVAAQRGRHTLEYWEKDREVVIHSFNPKVMLDLGKPVLKLAVDGVKTDDQPNNEPSDRGYAPASKYSKEILMETAAEAGLYSSFMLCRTLPESAIHDGTAIWPPLRLPTPTRVRNDTSNGYQSSGHRPTRLNEVSEYHWRLRKWVEFNGRRATPRILELMSLRTGLPAALGMAGPYFAANLRSSAAGGMGIKMPEDVTTFASLPRECFTPTPQKPWQGLWCGDYSGHGCEFLVILQPDKKDERALPSTMHWLRQWFRAGRRGSESSGSSYSSAQEDLSAQTASPSNTNGSSPASAQEEGGLTSAQTATEDPPEQPLLLPDLPPHHPPTPLPSQQPHPIEPHAVLQGFSEMPYQRTVEEVTDYENVPTGRLEAIKLTGDPNIPRGEYTWIAPDIGHGGFLRVADEWNFRGARVVRSAGHIAGRGFREGESILCGDQYTPSQLIMVSHDRLAQFWEGFGHISYYQRVDLDALLRYTG